jgi:aquaporin rerated protein, invertebrate
MAFVLTLAQSVGAVLGYGLLQFLTPEQIFSIPPQGTCVTILHPTVSVTQGFFVEFVLTSALICMICGVWDPRNAGKGDSAPLRIGRLLKPSAVEIQFSLRIVKSPSGLSIAALSIAGAPYTDASMNPVRSLGPALWNWNWENHWLYWVSPMAAGVLASCFYRIIFWRENPRMDSEHSDPSSQTPKHEI